MRTLTMVAHAPLTMFANAPLAPALLAGPNGREIQSALQAAGRGADRIGDLWNVFLAVTTVVYIMVMLAFLYAILHRRRSEPATDGSSRTATLTVSIASGLTLLTLFGLLIASIVTSRANAAAATAGANDPRSPKIKVTGHQWWWQVEYEEKDSSKRILSANELFIPAGVPVELELKSSDVIHSFWVPNLQGKRDLIPGMDNRLVLEADHPGVYRGQCAEFCGEQHAKMALWVTALTPAQYAQWAEDERKPSKIPSTAEQRQGMEIFLRSPCPLCHTIRGTNASGNTAPDLTHFATRRSIAAGTLPNRRGNVAGWILDPQHVKPGSAMPPMALGPGEVEPLLAYLESLQ